MPRRTSQYVEALSDTRTQLAVVFNNLIKGGDRYRRGYWGHRGMSSSWGLVKPPGQCNCQSRTGTRGLSRDVSPPEARGGGRGAMQRAGPRLVLSGCGRELPGLAAILSLPMGVGGCET